MKRCDLPSQKRYRENHPASSFRLKRPDKEKLDAIIEESGKPLSQWVANFINGEIAPQQEISELANNYDACKEWAFELDSKNKELERRIKEMENEGKFILSCSVCGKAMFFSSKDSNWKTEIYPKLKEIFGKRCHIKCKSSIPPSPIDTINSKEDLRTQ
ncbi:MAG: hypothetical protein ABSB80_03440 [Methanoregula sp.]|jgi:dimeric dUTPase (all-alpha-NTP-PPase superfamily)|uniref:hypothetical protein n=1 Tax=Methanoregula sp. TaxID=2052170 RepID=UPI003D0C764D